MKSSRHIGLVGCGRCGRLILRDLKSLGCRVSVVAASDTARQNASGGADIVGGDLSSLPEAALEVSSAHRSNRRSARLECEGGVAILSDSYESHIEIYRSDWRPEKEVETISISTAMPLLRELETFVNFLGGGPPPRSNADEGLAIVESIHRLRVLAGIDSESH